MRDYCLGKYGGVETKPLRDNGCISHLVIIFRDRAEGIFYSLGLCIVSRPGETREDVQGMYLATNIRVTSEDCLDPRGAPKTWDLLRDDMDRRCQEANGSLHVSNRARDFIGNYLKVLSKNRLHVPDVD